MIHASSLSPAHQVSRFTFASPNQESEALTGLGCYSLAQPLFPFSLFLFPFGLSTACLVGDGW